MKGLRPDWRGPTPPDGYRKRRFLPGLRGAAKSDTRWGSPQSFSSKKTEGGGGGGGGAGGAEEAGGAMGQRKVFIVGDAERLIPQIGTEVAANALLKALEEPPADSVIIITAADPNALLPTILSRVVLVRVARIDDSAVTAFAQQTLEIESKEELHQRVTAAAGCIGKLFAADAPRFGGAQLAARFTEAPLVFALGQVPYQARGGFTDMLDVLADRLRDEAKRGGDTDKLVEAIALVMDARDVAQGNVNPQLLAAVLAEDLHGTQRS